MLCRKIQWVHDTNSYTGSYFSILKILKFSTYLHIWYFVTTISIYRLNFVCISQQKLHKFDCYKKKYSYSMISPIIVMHAVSSFYVLYLDNLNCSRVSLRRYSLLWIPNNRKSLGWNNCVYYDKHDLWIILGRVNS